MPKLTWTEIEDGAAVEKEKTFETWPAADRWMDDRAIDSDEHPRFGTVYEMHP